MEEFVYTLIENPDSGELHLFRGKRTSETQCSADAISICNEFNKQPNSKAKRYFSCKDEATARRNCADLGRVVCANCIRELYETID